MLGIIRKGRLMAFHWSCLLLCLRLAERENSQNTKSSYHRIYMYNTIYLEILGHLEITMFSWQNPEKTVISGNNIKADPRPDQ